MKRVRIIADDLTGALDTAVQFCGRAGPLPVRWDAVPAGSGCFDTETRDASASAARQAARASVPALAEAEIAFKKIDSLLRGHVAVELAECLASGLFHRAVVAPAFPGQGRVTRGGRQYRRRAEGAGWEAVPVDLAARMAALGLSVRLVGRGARVPTGAGLVLICDAESSADLAGLVEQSAGWPGTTLWCGAAALGAALAACPVPRVTWLARPLLGVVGSVHAVSRAQMEAAGSAVIRLASADARAACARLDADGAALLAFDLPEGRTVAAAQKEIARLLAQILPLMPAPRSFFASGGATLRAACACLGIAELVACGELLPGIPVSRASSRAWGEIDIVSKSGAFGEQDLLQRLFTNPAPYGAVLP